MLPGNHELLQRGAATQIRLVHNGRDRDLLLMPLDDRTVDLMLQFSIKLVRVEPSTRLTEFRTRQTHATGDGNLHYGRERFILDAWTGAESVGFRENFLGEWRLSCSPTATSPSTGARDRRAWGLSQTASVSCRPPSCARTTASPWTGATS